MVKLNIYIRLYSTNCQIVFSLDLKAQYRGKQPARKLPNAGCDYELYNGGGGQSLYEVFTGCRWTR